MDYRIITVFMLPADGSMKAILAVFSLSYSPVAGI